jgi:hypothetical protein
MDVLDGESSLSVSSKNTSKQCLHRKSISILLEMICEKE